MTKIQKKVSYTKIFWDIFYDEQIHNNYTNILSIEFHRIINERRTNLQWVYSGSTVGLQWVYSGSTVGLQWLYSGSTVALLYTKSEYKD